MKKIIKRVKSFGEKSFIHTVFVSTFIAVILWATIILIGISVI